MTHDNAEPTRQQSSVATLDQFQGCLLGLALGDALGAPFEGGPLERLLWRAIGVTRRGEMRWTDDTQMTVDLVESFCLKVKSTLTTWHGASPRATNGVVDMVPPPLKC